MNPLAASMSADSLSVEIQARQESGRAQPRRYCRQEGRQRFQFSLLTGIESGGHHLGLGHAGPLFAGSAKDGARQQDAISGIENGE